MAARAFAVESHPGKGYVALLRGRWDDRHNVSMGQERDGQGVVGEQYPARQSLLAPVVHMLLYTMRNNTNESSTEHWRR